MTLVVNLSSNDTSEATVPATVTIAANQASATFAITAVDDALLDGTQTVTITGSATGYVSGTQTLDVTDPKAFAKLAGLATVPVIFRESDDANPTLRNSRRWFLARSNCKCPAHSSAG